jgi:hypothetical protein
MAQAWNATGHMTIAALAYRNLSPAARQSVDALLMSHPGMHPQKPGDVDWPKALAAAPDFDPNLYRFMLASTWPDDIRRTGNPYDHPEWHFVDYPLKPPSFPMESALAPGDNLLSAMHLSIQAVQDPKRTAEDRAAYLSWVIHLVGDVHQPLHCASLFTADYPRGDRGGNDFIVAGPRGGNVKLHAFWDDLLGTTRATFNILRIAGGIATTPGLQRDRLPELNGPATPEAWSLDSRTAAIKWAYLNGDLKGITPSAQGDAPPLPPTYATDARKVARRCMALAGYRLVDLLQGIMK